MQSPAVRFWEATRAAAGNLGAVDRTPELLLRFGVPGLMQRLGLETELAEFDSLLRVQKLTHTLLLEGALEMNHELQRSRLVHFFAKGIALLGPVYHVGDRHLSNIDLYVPVPQRDAALRTLGTLGYRVLPDAEQPGPSELRSGVILERDSPSEIQRIRVHMRWTLDPVERLVPRRERPIPDRIWDGVWTRGHLPAPSPEHHAAILAHHLVHTDLLHVRSILDLAYVFHEFSEEDGLEYVATCRELRIGRFAIILAEMMAKEFDIVRPYAISNGPGRWTHFTKDLTLERCLTIVAQSGPYDDAVMTIERIRRRLELVDAGGAKTLYEDLLFPPNAFLRWRWNADDVWDARVKHYRQLVRDALPQRRSRRTPAGSKFG
jgi:hypothetical protein